MDAEITKHLVIIDVTDDSEPVDMGVLYLTHDRIRWLVNQRVVLDMTWEQWALSTTQMLGGALRAQG